MEMQNNETPRPQNPRRRRRSKLQVFKEAYLPTIILAITIVLILVFIIGGAVRNPKPDTSTPPGSTPASPGTSSSSGGPTSNQAALLMQEAEDLMKQAQALADVYDYAGALAKLESFSGDLADFPALKEMYQQISEARDSMVSWSASQVPNLSFHLLIADPDRAFNDDTYGSSYKKNFITTSEFSAILQQLYDNGYMLVSLDDFYSLEYSTSSGREIYVEKQLVLPAGKKPIMLTETNANYYTYMTDSNSDGKADAGADGFACRLVYDNGFYNELVNADGSISTGSYDMVPILEDFIAENPDFSYNGARAIISFSGYDGILGCRINSTKLSASRLQEERDGAVAIVQALKDAGYDLACYTYKNIDYSSKTAAQIQADLQKWSEEITPWLGEVDILVFAKDKDIAGTESYSGSSKFNVLYNAGFRFFLGAGDTPWNQVDDLYIRQNRLAVTGSNLLNHPELYTDLFDAASVLDSARS